MAWIPMSYVEVNWNDDVDYDNLSFLHGRKVRCPICKRNQFEALGHYKICVNDDCKTALVLKGISNELRYLIIGEEIYE